MTKSKDNEALRAVAVELADFRERYPDLDWAEGALSVLLANCNQLKRVVSLPPGQRTRGQLRSRAARVAAMAVRFMVDIAGQTNPVTDDLMAVIGEMDEKANARLSGVCPRCFGWLPGRCVCAVTE